MRTHFALLGHEILSMQIIQALFSLCIISSAFLGVTSIAVAQETKTANPRIFLIDGRKLTETKRRIESGDQTFTAALAKLETDARRAMQQRPLSVVTKAVTPPSGDKHDYTSQAPYFWPDPNKPDGRPYINRDGERNPELDKITDHLALDQMEVAVRALSLAYYFKTDEEYAAKATQLLRVWFLDPATRMNPNLEYAQFIPGVNTGRGIGLIETRGLANVVDAIGLLAGSRSWTSADQEGLEAWFGTFLQWMQESRNGREENAKKNNHGTFYDVQAMSFALFVRRSDLAKQIAEAAKEKRIMLQIEPDGRQPLELSRTKAWSYSNFNLDGLMMLARLAENSGVDLWVYETKDGRSIRRALEYLYPYASEDRKWTYQQIGGFEVKLFFPLMRRAAAHYQDEKFKAAELRIPKSDPSDREHLLSGK
ncbi:MAG TPA: alginate lyase family protein [Pyrinomonadaceae bacterium]|nr:alginate lyase family protein [Pyrinomonadaceae bacterium]